MFFMSESWIIIPISPNANDHIILVWLKNVPVENGIKLIPNAKQYAKCDMIAKIINLNKYFFYFIYPVHLIICGIIRIYLHGDISVIIGG